MNKPGDTTAETEVSPEVLAAICELLSSHNVRSAHYIGNAREPMLRLLVQRLGTAFSVMDMPDRYETGAAYFWDGPGEFPGKARPEWLDGISFVQEGCPKVDLLIRDTPWSNPMQVEAIVRRRPIYLLLIDGARSEASHPAYSWELTAAYALGTIKNEATSR